MKQAYHTPRSAAELFAAGLLSERCLNPAAGIIVSSWEWTHVGISKIYALAVWVLPAHIPKIDYAR